MSARRMVHTADAAVTLGLTQSSLRKRAAAGRIPGARKAPCCGKWVVPTRWVEEYKAAPSRRATWPESRVRAEHGTNACYVGGCRRDECREAHSAYEHERRGRHRK